MRVKEIAIRYKTLLSNFTYLSLLHVFNLLIPFITFPYLISILGTETYGLVIFAQTLASYLAVLVNFGFDLYATKEIAKNRDNSQKLSEIVSSVLTIKGLLCIVSFFLLWVVGFFIDVVNNEKWLFIFSMFICINEWVFPKWFFLGMEKMKYITVFNLLGRVLALILIFILIKDESDYLMMPLLYGLGALVGGIYALWMLFSVFKVSFQTQSYRTLKFYTAQSFPLFVSSFSIQIYNQTNKLIIGGVLGMAEVTYYNIAEKMVEILKAPQILIIRTIYPKLSQVNSNGFARKMFKISIFLTLSIFIAVLLGADYIILILEYITTKTFGNAADILRILSIVIPVIGVNSYYSTKVLIEDKYRPQFMWMIVLALVVYLTLYLLLSITSLLSLYSIPLLTVSSEVFILLYSYYLVRKYHLF